MAVAHCKAGLRADSLVPWLASGSRIGLSEPVCSVIEALLFDLPITSNRQTGPPCCVCTVSAARKKIGGETPTWSTFDWEAP